MRRLALPIAAGALLALAAIAALGALRPSTSSPAATLAAELRCPDCEGLSVAESPSRSATEIRRQIDALLAEGRTPDAVRQHFVDRYGEWILLAPRSPLAWVAPVLLLGAGVAVFVTWLRLRPGGLAVGPPGVAPPAATARPDDDVAVRRVRDEAEALDV